MIGSSALATATMGTVAVLVLAIIIPPGTAYFLPDSGSDVVKRAMDIVRDKRYTDTQERASSFCTGMCMYEERKAYSDCFDLCNWNGRGPSPWTPPPDKQKYVKESLAPENSLENMQSFMRTGGTNKAKDGKTKMRNGRSGTKKERAGSWDVSY